MIGLSGESFGNWLVFATIITILLSFVIVFIAYKRGVNITSHKFQICMISGFVVLLLLVPFWLTDLAVKWKVLGTVFGMLVGIGNYLFISKIQKTLAGYSKDDGKGDGKR